MKAAMALGKWVSLNTVLAGVVFVGLVLVLLGGWLMVREDGGTEVEIIEVQDEVGKSETEIWVDVQGAVVSPGVYQLAGGARVKDALVAAGGLAEDADRDRVSRYINLAARVGDGVKVFVPRLGEAGSAGAIGGSGEGGEVIGVEVRSKVNINTASEGELDKLWGIGPTRAQAIIDGRPYVKVEEVAKVIPSNVYERIRDELTVF